MITIGKLRREPLEAWSQSRDRIYIDQGTKSDHTSPTVITTQK